MELNPNTIGDRPAGQQRMTTQRLDYDGLWITQVKVRASTAEVGAITPQEFVSGGIWTAHLDEPISDLLVNKITETRAVPGLYVPTTRYDPQLGPINGTRRLVENSGLITSLTATVKTTYEPHPNSKVVVYEMIETNSDGTGSSGNPAYPERVVNLYEESRGAVERVSQIVADIISVGSLVVTGATATLIRYEPLNQFLRDKIVETFTLNGPLLRKGERYDKDLGLVTSTQQLVDGTSLPAQSESATGLIKYETSPYGNPVVIKIVESWVTANFPTNTDDIYDASKGSVEKTSILSTDINTAGSVSIVGSVVTETSWKPRNAFLRYKNVETWTVDGPLLRNGERYDKDLGIVTSTRQLVDGTSLPAQSEGASGLTKYEASPVGNPVVFKIVESWDTAAFPIAFDNIYDPQKGAVNQEQQLTTDTSGDGSLSVSSGSVTQISYKPRNEFLRFKITETWTLPGELLRNNERYDKELGLVTSTRQLVDGTNNPTQSESANGLTKYEASPMGFPVIFEIIESWDTAAFPIAFDNIFDPQKLAVTQEQQLTTDTGSPGSLAVSGNSVTEISYKPRNEFLRFKITQTWTLPGSLLRNNERYDKDLGLVTSTRQLIDGTNNPTQSESASGLTKYEASPIGFPVIFEIIESWDTGSFPVITSSLYDDQKGDVDQDEQLTTDTASSASFAISGQDVTDISYKPRNKFLRTKVTQTWTLGEVFVACDVDDETQTQVIVTTTTIATPGAISGNVAGTQVNYVPTNEFYGRKIEMTLSSYPSRTETHLANYVFPALVTGHYVDVITSLEGRDKFTLNLNRTASRSRVVPHTVEISYGANGSFSPPSYLVLGTQDLSYQGVFFNVQASSVLTDAISVVVNTGGSNPDWGFAIETYSVDATSPSASDYIAQVGNPVVISYVIKPWKYNLWRMEVISIPLQ